MTVGKNVVSCMWGNRQELNILINNTIILKKRNRRTTYHYKIANLIRTSRIEEYNETFAIMK